MSFWISVLVPHSKGFADNVQEMKDAGLHYVPDRKCWVGEVADMYEDVAATVGGFVCESEECPFPSSWSNEKLLRRIDLSCDFSIVGRKNVTLETKFKERP